MNENHLQSTTPTLIPPGGKPLTLETAVAAIKKVPLKGVLDQINKENPVIRARDKHRIPYKAGTKEYQRAFYWCKKLDKIFPEIKEDFESGKITLKKYGKAPAEPTKIPDEKLIPPDPNQQPRGSPIPQPESMWVRLGVTSHQQELIKILKEISESAKETTATLKLINANVGSVDKDINAMNNNILELRKEMEGVRDDLRRSQRGKHQ